MIEIPRLLIVGLVYRTTTSDPYDLIYCFFCQAELTRDLHAVPLGAEQQQWAGAHKKL